MKGLASRVNLKHVYVIIDSVIESVVDLRDSLSEGVMKYHQHTGYNKEKDLALFLVVDDLITQ